ncbi:MAG: hypothetical protein DBX47_01330 [Clostridiales bacterium]|nr:MAG: hypothetical protein DBX47_01330 [Clostridiales bacterium]
MQKMERRASDNKYLHKDFHVSLDLGIAYVGDRYGEDAVKEYLTDYAKSYYCKMTLAELDEYFKKIYEAEDASDVLKTSIVENSLTVEVSECPAMKFMRSTGHEPSKYYGYTTKILYAVLAQICGFEFNLSDYDEKTGKAKFIFSEVPQK